MNKKALSLIFFTLIMSLSIIVWFTKKVSLNNNFTVICTTTFLADALKNITAQTPTSVVSLMGPGIDPHLYKAREQDMHQLSSADLIVYHGLHLEGKMAELFTHLAHRKPTVCATAQINPTHLRATQDNTIYDPHIWFDVLLWIQVIKHITNELCTHNPQCRQQYQENSRQYCQQLTELNTYVAQKAASIPHHQRVIITAHDAFAYFGRAYGFDVLGLQGISTDADISCASVHRLAEYIATRHIPVIFTETSIPVKNIMALQEAVAQHNAQVTIGPELYTDSLSDHHEASDYINFMQYTIDTITASLEQKM